MSRERAMDEAKRLKAIMVKHGVRCSIELQVGRPNVAGSDWYTLKRVLVNHHTAGSNKGLTPSLSLCKRGRADLPGPLPNGYGGRDFVYRIITMGLANHPGEGGPITLAGFRVPKDSARAHAWGTEWEHDGRSKWPPKMVDFMARSNAALLEYHNRPVEVSIEHSTWSSRKIDRNRYTARSGQREIQDYLDTLLPGVWHAKYRLVALRLKKRASAKTTIARVQHMLAVKGFLKGGYLQGRYGSKTRAAVKAYQRRLGRPRTGVLTRRQLARLVAGRYRVL